MRAAYESLLNDVCVRLGFCGAMIGDQPAHVDQFLPRDGLVGADAFADALFQAEGFDPHGAAAAKHRPSICAAFVRHFGDAEIDVGLLK